MKRTFAIAEGPDDVRALREILDRVFSLKNARDTVVPRRINRGTGVMYCINNSPERNEERYLEVACAMGRQKAELTVIETLKSPSDIDRIALIFDPDDDNDWKSALKERLRIELSRDSDFEVTSDLSIEERGEIEWKLSLNDVELLFTPIPWDTECDFDSLPSSRHQIERTALEILKTDEEDSSLVLDILSLIQGRNRKTCWKTAFRLFNAIRAPGVESFFDKVFGQDKRLREAIEDVLKQTLLHQRIERLKSP